MTFKTEHLTSLLKVAFQNNASDVHLREGEAPCLRIKGELYPVKSNREFSHSDMIEIARIIGALDEEKNINDLNEFDGAFTVKGVCRMRYNIFKFNSKIGVILRIVNNSIPTIEELGLSPSLYEICKYKRGLVLVTGATGSGKSTTLATMIDDINEKRGAHILTIEDPIEFVHPQKKSRVTQREVGRDTKDFKIALRSALRQDPDIILIGELRDAETISTAIKASETGHLVFATIHTKDVVSTIGRIIAMFPNEEQEEVRKRLSETLTAIVSQRILKSLDNKGACVAQEILLTSAGVKECILGDEPLSRLTAIMNKGSENQTFDGHIMKLYKDGLISKEIALENASNQSDFIQGLEFE